MSRKSDVNSLSDGDAPKRPSLFFWLRGRFFAGIVIAAPIAITVGIVSWLISEIDKRIKPLIPEQWNPETYTQFAIPGLGVLVAIILLILLGAIGTNLIGRSMISAGDRAVGRVPVVRNIYSLFKQLFETLASSQQASFKEMVLIEYPKRGTWCVGFVTASVKGEIRERLGEGMTGVFVPTTPNPTSGFYMFAPEKELIRLNMTVEEGAKLIVSAGMVVPENTPTEMIDAVVAEAARKAS